MHKLILLRHGESQWNLENRFTGWTDVDLSKKGFKEATSSGKVLKENSFEIDLAVPGMKKEDFTIELNDKVLVISSETSNTMENDKMRLNEFNFSSFQRSFRVPDLVDLDKIKASYKNGILKIKLPKRKESISKPNRVINIG